jgi:phosphatidylinositol alpha-mannosyltransferase
MRIALVTEFYYPHLGGVTEHVHHLATEFRRQGHETVIITSRMSGEHHDGPFVRRVGTSRVVFSNGSFARITTGFGLRRSIEAILREERIDVVHVHGPLAPTLGLIAPAAAHRLDIPVVGTFHSWFPRCVGYRLWRIPCQKRLDRYAATIAVSVPVIEAHARYFRANWRIIPNGVNTEDFRPNGRLSSDAFSRGPRLLFLGRLDPRNGLDTVLDAMPRIIERFDNARLIIAGDGPLRPWYESRARSLGSHVEFLGRVNGERPHIYGTADLYLCPTTKASFGITLLESMACGTPMIVSDITGFRELVAGGDEARLVPRNDAAAWAARTIELIEDPACRDRMAEAGRTKSERFAWPKVASEVLEVYREIGG